MMTIRSTDMDYCFVCETRFPAWWKHENCKPRKRSYEVKKRVLHDVQIESVSLIPAPKCANCDCTMVAHDATRWHCVRPSCPEAGKPVHTGSYPFFIAAKEHPTIQRVPVPEPFTCPRCKLVSHNPIDKKEGYCAACGDFTRDHPDNPLPKVK